MMLVNLNQFHNWRLRYHLQLPNGVMADPNGLCQFNGTYHIFHQYEPRWPQSWGHGWGHWSSPDLLTWYWHGGTIMPSCQLDKNGSYSGSTVIRDGQMWCYYTGNELMGTREDGYDFDFSGRKANETLVTSDDGIHFTTDNKRLVLGNEGYPAYCSNHVRDPKVWWQNGAWHMLLGCRTMDSHGCALLYQSADGLSWEMEGSATNTGDGPFGYMWECPNVVQLGGREFLFICPQGLPKQHYRFQCIHNSGYFPIEGTVVDLLSGDKGLMEADGPYPCIDESTFVELDYGFDFYADQCFVDERGRTILIGWAAVADIEFEYDVATTPEWTHTLTMPRELSLNETGKICQWPVEEMDSLRRDEVPLTTEAAHGATGFMGSSTYDKFDMTGALGARTDGCADVTIDNIEGLGHLMLNGDLELVANENDLELVFQSHAGRFRSVRRLPYTALSAGRVESLRVMVDTSVVEIYVNGGEATMTTRWFPLDIKNLAVTTTFQGETHVYQMGGYTFQNIA